MTKMTPNTSRRNREFGRAMKLSVAAGLLAFGLAAGDARAADEIVIGASVPLSGPLAGFGSYEQWGYKRAFE